MAGTGLDANERRLITALAGLEPRRKLETMARNHPIVVVSSRDHRRGIACTGLEVMQGRIGIKNLELARIIAATIFAHPCPPDRELMKPQHIHDTYPRQSNGKQLRTLCHRCPYQ